MHYACYIALALAHVIGALAYLLLLFGEHGKLMAAPQCTVVASTARDASKAPPAAELPGLKSNAAQSRERP